MSVHCDNHSPNRMVMSAIDWCSYWTDPTYSTTGVYINRNEKEEQKPGISKSDKIELKWKEITLFFTNYNINDKMNEIDVKRFGFWWCSQRDQSMKDWRRRGEKTIANKLHEFTLLEKRFNPHFLFLIVCLDVVICFYFTAGQLHSQLLLRCLVFHSKISLSTEIYIYLCYVYIRKAPAKQ